MPRFPVRRRIPSLRSRLRRGETTIGSWLSFGYAPVAELMARAGFDWLVIDMEHTGIGIADALTLIEVIELAGVPPLVRVGANDALLIKRVLDAGAHGVVVPMINSAEEARRAVDSARYPPHGSRGAGLGRAHDFGMDFDGYRAWADEEIVVVVQIEHMDGVANIDAIMNVNGVDAFIVGPYDLSGSLGRPGEWDHPEVLQCLTRIRETTADAGIVGGYHVVHSDRDEMSRRLDEGYRFIAYGDDMVFLAEKVSEEKEWLAEIRRSEA
jgi:2-keto-3-deoxy-L-rhamnonate aldolase RhmA